MAEKLLIIGSGMAGGKLVEEILSSTPGRWDITIVGDEPEGNYNRIKLNYCLGDSEPEDFYLNPPSWYLQKGVDAILGRQAIAIDRSAKIVSLDDGRQLAYDHLVLATGSRPFVPTIRNGDLPTVMAIRSLTDARRARSFLGEGKAAIVVGGGLLGLELALVLQEQGLKVTVSQFMPTLMETQLDEEGGRTLQVLLEASGVKFIMNTYLTGVDPINPQLPEGALVAEFKDGTKLQSDVVLVSCGIRPNIDLAKASGLENHRGITVNAQLRTSDPSISAVGECIEYDGRIWGLVAPAYEQVRVLAAVLSGAKTEYQPGPPGMTRLKSAIPVISMGQFGPAPPPTGASPSVHPSGPAAAIETVIFHDPGRSYKKLLVRDNKLIGAVLVGDDLNADTISLHYSAGLVLPERRHELLFPGAGGAAALPDPSLWPDNLTVCDCNGVSAGKIRSAIADGADTVVKVMNATKAGTGCGNCKGKLKSLLVAQLGELKDDPSERWYVPGLPLERPAMEAFILERGLRSVSAILEAWPDAVDDVKTRNGLDFLLNYLYRGDYEVQDDSRTANDRYSGNIQKDGRFSVIPDIPAGLATPAQLRAIANVAEEYHAAIKVTGADRIGLYALEKKDLPAVWDKLQMGSGHAFTKTFRACKACVGSTYCRYGLADSLALGERMAKRYRGVMGPAKFKMGVSGCPRNCSEATIKDLGVVACEGGWDISIGGNGGASVVAAKPLIRVKTDDEVIRIADRFYEYYRRHARFAERSAPFIERVGFDTVAAAVLADWPMETADGKIERKSVPEDAADLEASFASTLAAYKDPWCEGRRPLEHFREGAPVDNEPAAEPYSSIASLAGPMPRSAQAADTARRGVMVDPNPTLAAIAPGQLGLPIAHGAFKTIIKAELVPRGGVKVVTISGKRLVVFHGRDNSWLVCNEACPHEGGPLAEGTFGNGKITCSIHQYAYDAKTGACNMASGGVLQVYPHEIRDGMVMAKL